MFSTKRVAGVGGAVLEMVLVMLLVGPALVGGAASAVGVDGGVAQTRQCSSADLVATYTSNGAGMGHRFGRIVLTNASATACRTGGYGGLSYVGHGDGTQVGAAADRDPSKVRSLIVQPGERVRSDVSETVAQNYPKKLCKPVAVDGFRVYVPNSTKSTFIAHPTTGCAKTGVHLISHRAYRRS